MPDSIVVDKSKQSAERLSDFSGLQRAADLLGSAQNIHIARLARSKKVLFLEGNDSKLLTRLATSANFSELIDNGEITPIPVGGFSRWERVIHAEWTFSNVLGENISMAALFDRDYRCKEEVEKILKEMNKASYLVHVLKRKEIENYLLIPDAIESAIKYRFNERIRVGKLKTIPAFDVNELIDQATKVRLPSNSLHRKPPFSPSGPSVVVHRLATT